MACKFTSRVSMVFTGLLFLAMAFSSPVYAQDCTPDDITLSSQADIDNFQANHGSCDRVVQDLTIEGNDILNLDGLSALTSMGGDLKIERNSGLINLDGLQALSRVGSLSISNNAALTDVAGLTALTSIDDWLHIRWNDELRHIDGLSGLNSVGDNIFIWSHRNLRNVAGLSGLTSVGGHLNFRLNQVLDNLNGLSNLTNIGESLTLLGNSNLTNVDGLSSLTRIGGDLSIQGSGSLINLNGLSGLTSVGDAIFIYMTALTELDGLSNVSSVGGDMQILENSRLSNLGGLSGIPSVQNLRVENNSSLADCQPLAKLVDPIDDYEPGPGPGTAGIPDVTEVAFFENNLDGCNSVPEILAEVPLPEINAGLNDAWFNPDTDGQGFFFIVFPEIRQMFMAWFTYDTERPPEDVMASLGEPGHRWLTAQGGYEDNVAVLDVYVTSGGVFDSQQPEPFTEQDGQIIVEFNTCNSGSVSYDIPSIDRQGVVPIERIVLDNVSRCYLLGKQAEAVSPLESN